MEPERGPRLPRRDALRLMAAGGAAAALGGALVAELVRRARLHRVSATRTQMGTLVNVTVVHDDRGLAQDAVAAAFDEIERLEAILSRHRPDTPLARLNRDGRVRPAPPELLHVTRAALGYAERTGGAFDPTVAPLLALWSQRSGAEAGRPSAEALARARTLVGWRGLRVEGRALALHRPGMSVTLDGIAKGYVVDRAVAALVAAGAGRVMVDAGGDVASGPEGAAEPWRLSIQHPREASSSLGVVELRGGCVATSGDYVQAFSQDRSAHHIVDPRTGRSPAEAAAVTVLAPTAMDADALSTAALVLGPDAGVALLESVDGVEGMVVTKSLETRTTSGFRAAPA